LSIIFGSLTGVMALFGLLAQAKISETMLNMMKAMPHHGAGPDPAVMAEKMAPMLERIRPWGMVQQCGMLLFAVTLVVVGIGMQRRRPWARQAAVMWGIAALAWIPFMIYVQTSIVLPLTQEAMHAAMSGDSMQRNIMDSVMGMQKGAAVVGTVIFYAPFPIILLALMGRSSAKNDLHPA
jgi:hypothetical protein